MDLKEEYERLVSEYYAACNSGDADRIAACFTPGAVHYFPAGTYGGPFVGAQAIAARWSEAVRELGSSWTVDELTVDAARHTAVLEWTHHKARLGVVLRGTEWIVFAPTSKAIQEVRAYYAAPQPPGELRAELGGFDYAARGYPVARFGSQLNA
jgi:SnoaL-like domain